MSSYGRQAGIATVGPTELRTNVSIMLYKGCRLPRYALAAACGTCITYNVCNVFPYRHNGWLVCKLNTRLTVWMLGACKSIRWCRIMNKVFDSLYTFFGQHRSHIRYTTSCTNRQESVGQQCGAHITIGFTLQRVHRTTFTCLRSPVMCANLSDGADSDA